MLVLEQAVFDKELVGRNFRLAIDYSLSAVGDADEIERAVSTNGANFGAWKNARFDELYPRQRSALDPAERARLIGEMQTVLDDEAPVVTLYADYNYRGYPKGCHGVLEEHRYNVLLRYMSEVWCEEGVLRK